VSDDKTKEAVVIDPANPPEVLPVLKEETGKGLKLQSIINTHHQLAGPRMVERRVELIGLLATTMQAATQKRSSTTRYRSSAGKTVLTSRIHQVTIQRLP
jgi:hypothetical protein